MKHLLVLATITLLAGCDTSDTDEDTGTACFYCAHPEVRSCSGDTYRDNVLTSCPTPPVNGTCIVNGTIRGACVKRSECRPRDPDICIGL